jgi:hypothetical protein
MCRKTWRNSAKAGEVIRSHLGAIKDLRRGKLAIATKKKEKKKRNQPRCRDNEDHPAEMRSLGE